MSSRVDDLETGSGDQADASVDDINSRIDGFWTGSGDQASMSLDDLSTAVQDRCSAISTDDVCDTSTALGAFIDDLKSACP